MSHTPTFRTIGDLVHEHAQMDKFSTNDGKDMLSLPYENATNEAANLYLSALSIIRSQRQENDRLTAEVGRLTAAHNELKLLAEKLRQYSPKRSSSVGLFELGYRECAAEFLMYMETINPKEPK